MSLSMVGPAAVLLLGLVLLLHYRSVRHRFAGNAVARAPGMYCDAGDASAGNAAADDESDISRMSSIIVGTLAAQKAFVSLGTHEPTGRTNDNFSIGYIGGYVEVILNRKGIISLQACQTIAEIVFAAMFEDAGGFELYERYLKLQEEGNAAVFAGINEATADVASWLEDNTRVPTGWSDHVHGKPRKQPQTGP